MSRVEPSQADQQQQIDDLLELERQREIQLQDTQAQHDLAVRRANEVRSSDLHASGEDRSTKAVSDASNQQSRGAEWVNFADRKEATVPVSVKDIHDQSKKVEESNNASNAQQQAHQQAMQHEARQRLTIQEIQNEAVKQSGIIRG
jgi:hypothetical protein